MKKPVISVIGLGFVGLSFAVVNAVSGFETIAVDVDKKKLELLRNGRPDFFEQNLEEYLKSAIRDKKIHFTDNIDQILRTDITFITVGTPSLKDGRIDLTQIRDVVLKLSSHLRNKKNKHLIVIKSTVTPATTTNLVVPNFRNLKHVSIVVNPEFVREGSTIKDLLEPHIIVIGETQKEDGFKLENYYRMFYRKLPEIIHTDPTTAEMIKYANNTFLATKISFINSIANICQNIPSADVKKIAYAIGKDPRIGPLFLNAGPGFGGSCLPKDLSALITFSDKFGDANTLLKAVKKTNENQPVQIVNIMKKMKVFLPKKRIAILGVAFKKDTDDIREAVSIRLINHLLKNRLIVNVHDPLALENLRRIFDNKISYFETVNECVKDTDCCLILTEWDEYRKLKASNFSKMRNCAIIDARRILDPAKFTSIKFRAIGLGD